MIVIAYCKQRGKKWLTPYLSRVSYNIPYIAGFIVCFFIDIVSCFTIGRQLMTFTQKPQSDSQWLTGIPMIARYLGFGKTKTTELIRLESLKSYRVGKKIMVRKTDIDSFIMFEKPFNKLTRPQREMVNCDEQRNAKYSFY